MTKKKVIAISGSTRHHSTNHCLINAIAEMSNNDFDIIVFDGIANLPQYNPDNDIEDIDPAVAEFKNLLNDADGILICTPEYAHGVPGALKNAIDWTVSTCEFSHKPTALITASTDGKYGHRSLLETLKVIEAENIEHLQLVISFAKTKINIQNQIVDESTRNSVNDLIADFILTINERQTEPTA